MNHDDALELIKNKSGSNIKSILKSKLEQTTYNNLYGQWSVFNSSLTSVERLVLDKFGLVSKEDAIEGAWNSRSLTDFEKTHVELWLEAFEDKAHICKSINMFTVD
jgi:hypothetical protein